MSSDIRKWFMKAQDKNGGAAKPAGTTALAKKPVLSIPEKPSAAPSMAACDQDCSARRKTSKYFASKTEKEEDTSAGKGTGRGLPKRKLQKVSDELEDDMKPLPAKEVHKEEEDDDDDDFVAPSKRKTPVKPPPSKKLKGASTAEAHGKTGLDDDNEDKMDEDAKTPSKASGSGRGRGRGRGRGGRGAGAAHGKTIGLDDDGEEDKMDEDAKTPSTLTR